MAKIAIPYLRTHTNKAGITSYFWEPSKLLAKAKWKPVPLGTDPGVAIPKAQARNKEVELWKAGGGKPLEVKKRVQTGTIGSLIARYRSEVLEGINELTGKPRIAPRTAEGYETGLKRIEAWAGQHPLAYVTAERVTELKKAIARPIDKGGLGHSPALNMLKTLRQLFAYAESISLIPKNSNPATKFELGNVQPRKAVWEADDEAAFIAAAYALDMPSMALAIELAIYTAQRQDDLIHFTEPQLEPLTIHDPEVAARVCGPDGRVMGWIVNLTEDGDELGQAKTGMQMQIAFEPVILAKVEAAIRINRARDRAAKPQRLLTHVLVDADGKPWKKRAFYSAYRAIIEHAAKATNRPHMLDLNWHDLRRTRVVRMRRRGTQLATIAALTGHSLQSIQMMLKVYGPIDATSTAAAIVSVMAPLENHSVKGQKTPPKRNGKAKIIVKNQR